MSAFIVKNKTINKIVSYIHHHHVYPFSMPPFSMPPHEYPLRSLGEKMNALNVEAVNARYFNDLVDSSGYSFRYELPPTEIEAYKMLQCFLYQCFEGDVPESKLYKDLEHVLARIASACITGTVQYQNASWD